MKAFGVIRRNFVEKTKKENVCSFNRNLHQMNIFPLLRDKDEKKN